MNRLRKGKTSGYKKGSKGNNSKGTPKALQTTHFPLTLEAQSANNGARKVILAVDNTLDKINEVVINKTMRLFQLSLLCNLKFEKNFLNKLSTAITNQIQKNNIFLGDEPAQVAGSRKVTIVPLVGSDQKEIAGILVTVEQIAEYDLDDDEEGVERPKKYDFWGVLCRDLNETSNNDVANIVNMPVFMIKGHVSVTNLILLYFSKKFDCTIREMKLSPIELSWLAAMWSAYPTDNADKDLKLKYVLPEEVEDFDKVGYTIAADNIRNLWNSVHDKDSDVFLLEEKNLFISLIEEHFNDYINLDLKKMRLREIDTTSIYANTVGSIKLYSSLTAEVIINYLTTLAIEKKF